MNSKVNALAQSYRLGSRSRGEVTDAVHYMPLYHHALAEAVMSRGKMLELENKQIATDAWDYECYLELSHSATPAAHCHSLHSQYLEDMWNSPSALGSPKSEAYRCIPAQRSKGVGWEQAEKPSKQRSSCRCPVKSCRHAALPSLFFGCLEHFQGPTPDQGLAAVCLASLDVSSRSCSNLLHFKHSEAPQHIIDS